MNPMHSGDEMDSRDQRYESSGRVVRLLYSLLIFSVIAYAVYFFGRPFLILEGAGEVVAPEKDVSVPFIADIRMVHVEPGQRVYSGARLVTLDRAGRSAALRDINAAIADRAQQINQTRRELTVAEQMEAALKQRYEALRAVIEQTTATPDAVDALTRAGLQRELSDALTAWEENRAARRQLPELLAELIEARAGLLRRRGEILTTWQNREVLAREQGTVSNDLVSEGDTVTPGEVVLRLLDQEQKYILWELPGDMLRLPRIGERVSIESAQGSSAGVVDRLLPLSESVTAGSGDPSQLVEVAITDPTADLPLESSVTVSLWYF